MSRRIVFAGGVQTRALARIFRGEIAGQTGDDVVFIGTGAVGTEAARSTLLLAYALVMEVDEDGDAVPAGDLPSRAEVVRVLAGGVAVEFARVIPESDFSEDYRL